MSHEHDEFDQVVWGDFAAGIQQLCDHLGYLDATIAKAMADNDEETVVSASGNVSNAVARIPWGTIPTLLMALARQVNTERGECIDMVQQWYLEARVIEEALKVLATIEAVPVEILEQLSKSGDRMDEIATSSKYASTVEK